MKKALLFLLLGTSLTSWSQCETSVVASDTSLCVGDTVTITASGPPTFLSTTFAAGNNHRGNMFDIVAINEVTIQSFDAHPVGTTDYEIYYKTGTYVGSEANAGAWTLVGSALGVVAQPTGVATPIPINVGVTIPAGQTYSFYVTSTNTAVSLNYSNGTTAGAVFSSDANIQFLEGAGMEYPFTAGGGTFVPRVWNGNIHYSLPVGTTFLWGNGASTNQITDTPIVQTTYYVDITPGGCPTVTDSVTIDVIAIPVLDLGADTAICPGTQITLDAGIGHTTYDWNNGSASSQTYTVAPGADYFVEVTNVEGCFAYDTINIALASTPVLNLGADTTICGGTSLTLNAENAGSTFDWSTSETSQSIVVGPGTYSVVVTNPEGCTNSDDIVILEIPTPMVDLGDDTTICVNQMATFDAGAGFTSYVWSTSDTSQTIIADGSTLGVGTHTISVDVTNSYGCTTTEEVIVNVDACLGLVPATGSYMHVYPNPTDGILHVELEQLTTESILNVYSTDGSLVLSERMTDQSHSLDLSRLENGAYIIELSSDDYLEIIRLIKD